MVLAFIALLSLTSGIMRHDVPEKAYRALAAAAQFDPVGIIYMDADTAGRGTGTLIGDRFVLSAAHVFMEHDYRQDTFMQDGKQIILFNPYNERVAAPEHVTFIIKGQRFQAKRIVLHPAYLDSATKGDCDVALIELEKACKEVKPARMNTAFDELGAAVVGVGFGASGIASDPETVALRNRKIAGENVIDSIGGHLYAGLPASMFCDFDAPGRTDCNVMGSAKPRPLEYICGGGDSGGGLFRKKEGAWELIGICTGSYFELERLLKTGYYGQTMSWTRVSVFQKWIQAQL